MSLPINYLTGLIIAAVIFLASRAIRQDRRPNFPPGPKRLPFLNNLLNFPGVSDAVAISKLGALAYAHVLGTDVLYLNRGEMAVDLLDKRSRIYSDRPRLVFAGELCGQNRLMPLMQYNNDLKLTRKWLQSALGPSAVKKWIPAMTEGAITLSASLASDPENFRDHIRRYSTTLVIKILYGIDITGPQDPYIRFIEEATVVSVGSVTKNVFLNIIPALRFLPGWLPGAGFRRDGEKTREIVETFANKPFEQAKRAMMEGHEFPSLASSLLKDFCTSPEEEDLVKWSISAAYGGGSDTSAALLISFVMAMVLYPECQSKAQAEIDSVMSDEGVPYLTFDQKEKLPYVTALVKECARWGSPIYLGPPHKLAERDEYQGHTIPKDTVCVPNIWAMLHDANIYPEPFCFNPERHMEKDGSEPELISDPDRYVYGFGRRLCPGIHIARVSNWVAIANILATTTISRIPGSTPAAAWHVGAIRHPLPFDCDIRKRNL